TQEFRGFGLVDQFDSEAASGQLAAATAPACVRTWFHTGAADWPRRFAADAYRSDPGQATITAHSFDNPAGLDPGDHEAALRALAGQVIRQEIFSTDAGGKRAAHPFQVTQTGYRLRRLQPAAGELRACFDFYQHERVTYDYEQQPDDPRIAHHM